LNEQPTPNPQNVNLGVQNSAEFEIDALSKELALLINKHGAKKLSVALDKVLAEMKI
jgi:hypothetical protein